MYNYIVGTEHVVNKLYSHMVESGITITPDVVNRLTDTISVCLSTDDSTDMFNRFEHIQSSLLEWPESLHEVARIKLECLVHTLVKVTSDQMEKLGLNTSDFNHIQVELLKDHDLKISLLDHPCDDRRSELTVTEVTVGGNVQDTGKVTCNPDSSVSVTLKIQPNDG